MGDGVCVCVCERLVMDRAEEWASGKSIEKLERLMGGGGGERGAGAPVFLFFFCRLYVSLFIFSLYLDADLPDVL